MIEIRKKKNCCGCSACEQRCPHHCIVLREDSEGFLYPHVYKERCTSCGICEKVCPVQNRAAAHSPLKVYAAKNKNKQELLSSSSGGLFVIFAKKIIKEGGVVFGAKFDESWNVVHAYTEKEEGIRAFMGSKYVQSQIGSAFSDAKGFLQSGRKVLFSGTPCQIAGLNGYLGHRYDNLLTIDVICHGVPSPMVWKHYLNEIVRKVCHDENSVSSPLILNSSGRDALFERITSISFRDKRTDWKKFSFALSLAKDLSEGKQNSVSLSHTFSEDNYMRLFLSNVILRPSCYHCPSKEGKSNSDITIADFWGIERVHANFDDERGVGLLLVNTEKGQFALDEESLYLKSREVSLSDAVGSNPSYYTSVSEPLEKKLCFFLLNVSKTNINTIAKIIRRISHFRQMKMKVKIKIRHFLKL